MATYEPQDHILWRIMDRLPKNSAFLGCLVILAWMIVAIPLLPFFVIAQWRRNSYRDKILQSKNRLLKWEEFLKCTQENEGSVIIEVGNKRLTRFWWTPDRILELTPIDPPKYNELNQVSYGGKDQHPFQKWCYEEYISPVTGTAATVDPGDSLMDADFETRQPLPRDFDQKMARRFLKQNVVIVTYYDIRYS